MIKKRLQNLFCNRRIDDLSYFICAPDLLMLFCRKLHPISFALPVSLPLLLLVSYPYFQSANYMQKLHSVSLARVLAERQRLVCYLVPVKLNCLHFRAMMCYCVSEGFQDFQPWFGFALIVSFLFQRYLLHGQKFR
jgi:hypothetical protein